MAIAARHADLATMAPDDVTAYVDTVLAVVYYKHRCDFYLAHDPYYETK